MADRVSGDGRAESLTYPESAVGDVVEDLHGHRIADPYRWLEDPDSEQTKDWVRRQNAFTEEQFGPIGERAWFADLMSKIIRRPRATIPVKRGGRYYLNRNDGTLDQDQIFVADTLEELRAGGRLLLDPNTLSADGTTSVRSFTVSDDGAHLCYQRSEGGSDWTDFVLIDSSTGEAQDDAAIQTKFSAASWLPDNRSYLYGAVPHAGRASGAQADAVQTGVIKLHRVGRPEDEDEVVLDIRADYRQGFAFPLVSDDRTLVGMHLTEGTERVNKLWIYRIEEGPDGSRLSGPIKVFDTADAEYEFVGNVGSTIIVRTDLGAARGRVITVDLDQLDLDHLDLDHLDLDHVDEGISELVAEGEHALQSVDIAGAELIVLRTADAQPLLQRYDLEGQLLGTVAVPGGAVTALWADQDSDEWFVGMSTVTSPTRAFRVLVGGGEPEALDDLVPDGAGYVPPEVSVERRRAVSADGTAVPYFLITPLADVPVEGPRPTLLYGYGGFNISLEAAYRPVWPGWLSSGGAVVIANLRGGGEYGREWYDGGRLANKQNVFDDFIAVGEDLVRTGVTSHDRLAIHGGSNGGLLVGATLTQRPDLAAVALPAVGVMDLLRFHKFTAGAAWTSDYGDPDRQEDFETALGYSPLHNIDPGAYPATLIMTGDHDDRVVPLHSHKFTATLQQAQQGRAPILTRIETQTGHGMGKPAAMAAAETADMLAFAAHFTGLIVPAP